MMTIRQTAVSFAAFLALASPALGQSSRSLGPSTGSVRIEQVQAGFIASGEAGGGTLRFRGRSYPITVGGLGIGSIGVTWGIGSETELREAGAEWLVGAPDELARLLLGSR